MTTDKVRRFPISLLAAWALIFGAFALHVWLYRAFYIDDALISLRFVEQFVAGNGLVYNVGERVEGYSNFLWVMLLAPFGWAQVDLIWATRFLGTVFGAGALACVAWFVRGLRWPWVAPALLVACAPFAAWVMGGLETLLFAFLLVAGAIAFVHEEERGGGWASGLLFGLLALTRPEGLMFAGLALLIRGVRWLRQRRLPARHEWAWMAALGLVIVPFYAWRIVYYGYPLPNTVYAKSMGGHPRQFMEGAYYVLETLRALGGWLAVALPVGLAVAYLRRAPWVNFFAAGSMLYLAFMLASGGDWMPMQRFLVQMLPLLVIVLHAGFVALHDLWGTGARWPRLAVLLLILGQLAFLLFTSLEARFLTGIGAPGGATGPSPDIQYVAARLQPGDAVAVDVAGAYAYYLPLASRIIDVNGLADGHIAHVAPQFPGGLWGRGDGFGKWDVDYVLAQQPRFVQLAITGVDAEGVYRATNTGQALLANDPRFGAAYAPVPGFLGLFERRPMQEAPTSQAIR